MVAINLFFSTQAFAQKITVKKMKGRTALVESSVPLEEGKTYDLQDSPITAEVNYAAQGLKSRRNSLTLGMNFSSFSSDNIQMTNFSLQGRYGWNFSYLEFGVLSQVGYLDDGGGAKTDFLAGGYFDYNLLTNRDGRNFIYGPFALVLIGSVQKKGGSANLIDFNGGGFFSYFPNKGLTAFRLEAYADYQQITASTTATTVLGAGGRALILFYF